MGDERVRLVIADAPYNTVILGRVSGLGRVQHREFAEASGEMTDGQFTDFLTTVMQRSALLVLDGGLGYWFMDAAHIPNVHAAASRASLEYKQTTVWAKNNAGMGAFYRVQTEFVVIVKKGRAPHVNNFGLGGHGRYRTTLWSYPGMNSFGRDRDKLLAQHPTVKPVALLADLIKDVSHRRDVILDPFGGLGSTLIAAEKTKRYARLIEIDAHFCDAIVRRWQEFTRREARLASTDQTFAEVTAERASA